MDELQAEAGRKPPCGARRLLVGYRPKGGDRKTPQVLITGRWLAEAGFEVGTGVNLMTLEGCLVLIPDSREETRLRALLQALNDKQQLIEQTGLKIQAALAG